MWGQIGDRLAASGSFIAAKFGRSDDFGRKPVCISTTSLWAVPRWALPSLVFQAGLHPRRLCPCGLSPSGPRQKLGPGEFKAARPTCCGCGGMSPFSAAFFTRNRDNSCLALALSIEEFGPAKCSAILNRELHLSPQQILR
jgi:hypothetical protein